MEGTRGVVETTTEGSKKSGRVGCGAMHQRGVCINMVCMTRCRGVGRNHDALANDNSQCLPNGQIAWN